MRKVSRRGLEIGLYTCLSLGLLDLVALNVWIVPSMEASATASKAPATARTRADAASTESRPEAAKPVVAPRATAKEDAAPRPMRGLLPEVRFATGQHRLSPVFKRALGEVAKRLATHPEAELDLVGHCDRRGSARLNRLLSQRRADVVKRELIRLGVAAKRLHARGAGASQPAARGEGEEAWAKNRRVQLRWR